jgi:two-component system, chemotaxis family, protein-glutamate methylesterase/glutaminase
MGTARPPASARVDTLRRDVIAIGGSAGALEPLKTIVAGIPRELPASVLAVLHLSPNAPSSLASILSRVGGMHAVNPQDGDALKPGYIYVANPDLHLEVTPRGIRQSHGPRINGVRPSVDVLFESAAETYGARVIGVVLSGGLDDGSAGLAAIREAGGVGIVQRPEDAGMMSMPRNAIARAAPEHVLDAEDIGTMLVELVGEKVVDRHAGWRRPSVEIASPVGANDIDGGVTGITCPDCHGTIWLKTDPGDVTFTCRIGHSYSPETFFDVQAGNVENALWAGVRSLEEQAALAGVMAARAEKRGDEHGRERYLGRQEQAKFNARTLRGLLAGRD